MAVPVLRVEFRGQSFKRQTARTYTHLVVGRQDIARDRARVEARRGMLAENHAYSVLQANPATRRFSPTAAQVAQYEADAALSAQAYVDRAIASDLARIEADRAAGAYERFCDLGWCGRPDLAAKLAARLKGNGWLDVTVLPVSR